MILYILITIAVLGLAYFGDRMQKEGAAGTGAVEKHGGPSYRGGYTRGKAVFDVCFVMIALILIIPAVLRQATGNDYMRYVEFFHLAYRDQMVATEPGFNLLSKAVYTICGYENYLLMFALFAIPTVLLFLAAIRMQAEDFFMSFFLFMMFGYYFQSYNTVRYYFALAVALFSVKSFLEKRYVSFVLLILFAAAFHKSVLAVLVLYPAAAYAWKKWQLAAAGALGAAFILFQDLWMKVIIRLYPSYRNTDILAQGGSISWGNIAKCLLVLLLVYAARRSFSCSGDTLRERRHRFYINCTFLALFIYVFGYFVPEISRICFYLTITQIFLIPDMLRGLKANGRALGKYAAALVCALAAASFAFFLHSAYDTRIRILPYGTFLFHELPDTPSRSIEK